jgi:hypothetical protein
MAAQNMDKYRTPVVALIEQPRALESAPQPLSSEEKVRLGQLLRVIERGLSHFMSVGAALLEVRSSRLYRETHSDFQSWCRETLGLARSSVDGLIRSGEVAQLLIDNGVQLPANTTEAVVRPVSTLPSPELQIQAWRLVQAVSPQRGPSQPISSKVCRVIKNALEPNGSNGNGHKPRHREHPSREQSFTLPVQRLAKVDSFDVNVCLLHVKDSAQAERISHAAGVVAERCQLVQERLAERFPELSRA